MKLNGVGDVRLYDVPTFLDNRGYLSVIQGGEDIPFQISRIFYTHGIGADISRGSHAHKSCWQALICLCGSLDIEIDDLQTKQVFTLDSPSKVLVIPPLIWSRQYNFSGDSICLVLASESYSPDEYLQNYEDFKNFRINENL